MPIKDLTESVRLPRLGKIRLGTRHPEKGYPMKADHFVFPQDMPNRKQIIELYGETPKSLPVMIPVEDEEVWATQYYRSYNMTYGLVCKGDGETAMRMVDVVTGELPVSNKAGTVRFQEMRCLGRDCPEYQAEKCRTVMNLRFVLPEVPGLGIWQIDTGSKNSILNINSCAKLIKQAFGRISLIPLKLTFEPMQVNNPENGKRQTVYVLNLRSDITIAQLATSAKDTIKMLQEGVTLEGAYDNAVQDDIETYWPEDTQPDIPDDSALDEIWPDDGDAIPPHAPKTEAELLSWVAEIKGYLNHETARSYLIHEGGISKERIKNEPGRVWMEIQGRGLG